MRVNIGPYAKWIGPYQIADMLEHIGVSEELCFKIGGWLANTWVGPLCNKIYEKKQKRRIKVHIDPYDIWGADHTLACVIHPVLVALKEKKKGSPIVSDEDVPETMRSTTCPTKEYEWELDEHFHSRWHWVLDEMIWAFEQIKEGIEPNFDLNSGDWSYYMHANRVKRGLILFGKYYQGLWD